MYDIAAGHWDPKALGLAGVQADQLAKVVAASTVLGRLRPEIVTATGLPAKTAVVAGATDGVLANLGLGAVAPDVGAVSLGDNVELRAVRPKPQVNNAGRLFCYALTDDRWVLGGAVNNGGSAVRSRPAGRWPRLRPPSRGRGRPSARDERLAAEAATAPAGSSRLLSLPSLSASGRLGGNRGCAVRTSGCGATTPVPMSLRAVIEGVCQQLALVRDALTAGEVALREIRATGGAVASELWVATLASHARPAGAHRRVARRRRAGSLPAGSPRPGRDPEPRRRHLDHHGA